MFDLNHSVHFLVKNMENMEEKTSQNLQFFSKLVKLKNVNLEKKLYQQKINSRPIISQLKSLNFSKSKK